MKSMLHEGSTVVKAIQKAWEASGMPLEFTISVHEVGETNFLGFSKHPAVVSIAYDPKKVQQVAGQHGHNRALGQQRPRFDTRQNQPKGHKPKVEVKPKFYLEKDRNTQPNASRVNVPVKEVFKHGDAQVAYEQEQWTQEMVNDVCGWLQELNAHVGVATSFTTQCDRRVLTVTFAEPIMPTPDEERSLFIGLSYTLMQFLKKKCKKKLRGHHLVFNSKQSSSTTPVA